MNSQFKIHGNLKDVPNDIVYKMVEVHKMLTRTCGVPYHSVSVVYRPQDLGAVIIFSGDMKKRMTAEIRSAVKWSGFKQIFTF